MLKVGGYRTATIGEDMELVVRLHHHHRLNGIPYRITYVPDPVCWTEVPEDYRTLRNQRIRWQRGLCDSLAGHFELCCHPKGGTVGWLAFPFMTVFEWFGPAFEILGYGLLLIGLGLGLVSFHVWLLCVGVALGLGITLSLCALLMEEMTFHLYQRPSDLFTLVMVAVIENFWVSTAQFVLEIDRTGQVDSRHEGRMGQYGPISFVAVTTGPSWKPQLFPLLARAVAVEGVILSDQFIRDRPEAALS
ncbi:MAG: glycosyltransferase family 2 protein [Nitrospira sp.]